MAIYPYSVKCNGEYYESGEDVPEVDVAGGENPLPFSDDDIMFETKENKQYTKTDIIRMSTSELQNLAAEEGINNALETSGSKLKDILIKHFGL